MATITGRVSAVPGRGIPGLVVSAGATTEDQQGPAHRLRLGSVLTDSAGAFNLGYEVREAEGSGRTGHWNLAVWVEAPGVPDEHAEAEPMLLAREERGNSSGREVFRFLIPEARLTAAGVGLPTAPTPEDAEAAADSHRIARRLAAEARTRRFGQSLGEMAPTEANHEPSRTL
jgi:hypothetical protein